MRRFLITSPAFTGEAELLYNEFGVLVKIDCTRCHMMAAIMKAFKARIATDITELQASLADTKATIVEAEFVVTFDMFWQAYGHKINKKRCEPLWERMSKGKQVKALMGITAYHKFLKKEGWRTKADPENYLKNEMYDNEYN